MFQQEFWSLGLQFYYQQPYILPFSWKKHGKKGRREGEENEGRPSSELKLNINQV